MTSVSSQKRMRSQNQVIDGVSAAKKPKTNSRPNRGRPKKRDLLSDSEDEIEEYEEPLTRDEIRQLSLDVNKIPGISLFHSFLISMKIIVYCYLLKGDQLSALLVLIQKHEPSTTFSSDEVEIDFESLKTSTLRELQKFVSDLLRKQKNRNKCKPLSLLNQFDTHFINCFRR